VEIVILWKGTPNRKMGRKVTGLRDINPGQTIIEGTVMKKIATLLLSFAMMSFSLQGYSWNLGPENINALRFIKNGTIYFTLVDEEEDGGEYFCNADLPDGQWLFITKCGKGKGNGNKSASPSCIASVDRMASMLLEAQTSGLSVYVEVEGCKVTEVALKPEAEPEPEPEIVIEP